MKFKTLIIASLIVFSGCSNDDTTTDNETEFKQKMREFVIGISQYSKAIKPNTLYEGFPKIK